MLIAFKKVFFASQKIYFFSKPHEENFMQNILLSSLGLRHQKLKFYIDSKKVDLHIFFLVEKKEQ